MITSSSTDRAVSDTIGTVIMVAIVFLLAVTVGGFVLAEYDNTKADVYATVQFQQNTDDSISVVWTGEETAQYLEVTNGTEKEYIEDFHNTSNNSVTMWYGPEGNDIEVYAHADGRRTLVTQYEPPEFKSTVYARSRSGDGLPQRGTIVFNGTEIPNKRGIHIFVFNEDGTINRYGWYDTHSNDRHQLGVSDGASQLSMGTEEHCEGCARGKAYAFLDQSVAPGQYVLIVGQDQPARTTPDLAAEFKRMGAQYSHDDQLEYRDSWIIASQKTSTSPDEYRLLFEKHEPRMQQSEVGFVDAYFYAPHE